MIVLQTDFSQTFEAVGIMKGIIKSYDPHIEIIDGNHGITPFDVYEASLSLRRLIPYYPRGTYFVSVVDPHVGSIQDHIVAHTKSGHFIISPNNGTLTHMKKHLLDARIIDPKYLLINEGYVFEGRDLYANVAGLLESKQMTYEQVGQLCDLKNIIVDEKYHHLPLLEKHKVSSFIMRTYSHFGGIEIQVRNEEFLSCDIDFHDKFHVVIKKDNNIIIDDNNVYFEKTFSHVEKNALLIYPGSGGYISLDINQGHLVNTYNLKAGLDYQVILDKMD